MSSSTPSGQSMLCLLELEKKKRPLANSFHLGGPSIQLTAQEQAAFGQLYTQVDPNYTQIVSGDAASQLFMKSGLSPAVLGDIWQMADPNNNGFLDQQGFSMALRMIGHVQNGQTLSPNLGNIRKYIAFYVGELLANHIKKRVLFLLLMANNSSSPRKLAQLNNSRWRQYLL